MRCTRACAVFDIKIVENYLAPLASNGIIKHVIIYLSRQISHFTLKARLCKRIIMGKIRDNTGGTCIVNLF